MGWKPEGKVRFALCTDLDGTFLGGSDAGKAQLYDAWRRPRAQALLIFVTGRDLDFVEHLCRNEGVPVPDFVVGDVGTSVVAWPGREPIAEVEQWIDASWQNPEARIRALLAEEPGLRRQAVQGGRRVSYLYDPNVLRPEAAIKAREAGFDVTLSAETFFDVLPKGVAKGSALRRLLTALEVSEDACVVSGDTLNDLSLFEMGVAGIAVGNAEPKLKERIQGWSHVYHARAPGTDGIIEGLTHLGHWPLPAH